MFQRIHNFEGNGTAARMKHILYTFDGDATNLLENNTKLTQILLADMGLCFLSLAVNGIFLFIAYVFFERGGQVIIERQYDVIETKYCVSVNV